MHTFKSLKQQVFALCNYKLVPIRHEDRRYKIMQWRNEQIYHLRQSEPLVLEMQNKYFDTIVANLFDQKQPGQTLFSFLKHGKCISYRRLVHINWVARNAEGSFVMATGLNKESFATVDSSGAGAFAELLYRMRTL